MPKHFCTSTGQRAPPHSNLGRAAPAGHSHASAAGAGLLAMRGKPLLPPATQPGVYTQRGGASISIVRASSISIVRACLPAQPGKAAAPVRRPLAGAGTRPGGPRARPPCGTPASRSARCCSPSTAAAAGPPRTRRPARRTCACTARWSRRAGRGGKGGAGGERRAPRPPAAHGAERGRGQAQVLQAEIRLGLCGDARRDLGLEAREGGCRGNHRSLVCSAARGLWREREVDQRGGLRAAVAASARRRRPARAAGGAGAARARTSGTCVAAPRSTSRRAPVTRAATVSRSGGSCAST